MDKLNEDPWQAVSLTAGEDRLSIDWADGHQSQFYWIWLRDNAPEARHENGQKLIETTSIALDIRPQTAASTTRRIRIHWTDGQVSDFDPGWLRSQDTSVPRNQDRLPGPVLWDAGLQRQGLHWGRFGELVRDPEALRGWLQRVRDNGFGLLREVPPVSEALFRVVDLFGYVRETNYGRYFDVKVVPDPANLADTNLGLSPHTDNPYRDPVPTLQVLHCLENSASGGESILVDGFMVARIIREQHPQHFRLLTSVPVRFQFRSADTDLVAEAPFIQLDSVGDVTAIRFNNRSVQPFSCPPELMADFYAAHRRLATLLEDESLRIQFKMAPGDLMLLDNTRVLHGRTAYTASGARHLQGCYADRDSLLSKLRVLGRAGREGDGN